MGNTELVVIAIREGYREGASEMFGLIKL